MATVVFTDTDPTYTDGGSSTWPGVYDASNGNPAGCFSCIIPSPVSGSYDGIYGYGFGGGVTWESFGVPSGGVVTAVQITGKDHRVNYGTGSASGFSIQYYMADYVGFNPIDGVTGVLGTDSPSINSPGFGWTSAGSESGLSVHPSFQASTTEIIFFIVFGAVLSSYGGSYDIDNIALTITYTPAASSDIKTVTTIVQASVKTVNGVAIASVKTIDGVTNV